MAAGTAFDVRRGIPSAAGPKSFLITVRSPTGRHERSQADRLLREGPCLCDKIRWNSSCAAPKAASVLDALVRAANSITTSEMALPCVSKCSIVLTAVGHCSRQKIATFAMRTGAWLVVLISICRLLGRVRRRRVRTTAQQLPL